ncbi:glycosyltransferase [Ferruginibacter sp.]
MIHVLCLAPYHFLPPKMGGQKYIALFNEFFGKEVNLTCISTKSNDAAAAKNYTVVPALSNSTTRYINFFYFFTLRKIIRRNKITHLIIEHPYYGWLGILLQKFCGVTLVVQSHNIEAIRFKTIGKWWWRILWRYEKSVHRKAGINFFITDADKDFAIAHFSLDAARCHTITYGTEAVAIPPAAAKAAAKKILQQQHAIKEEEKILLFNGSLDYKPNLQAVDTILQQINPLLLANTQFKYRIIICGKGLPAAYNNLTDYSDKNIIYAGFVEDIAVYFSGADIFINPVIEGGGIKTKLVESLSFNLTSVSTRSGALGISKNDAGNKLLVVEDNEWNGFAAAVMNADIATTTPPPFFDTFYWGNIAAKAIAALSS